MIITLPCFIIDYIQIVIDKERDLFLSYCKSYLRDHCRLIDMLLSDLICVYTHTMWTPACNRYLNLKIKNGYSFFPFERQERRLRCILVWIVVSLSYASIFHFVHRRFFAFFNIYFIFLAVWIFFFTFYLPNLQSDLVKVAHNYYYVIL